MVPRFPGLPRGPGNGAIHQVASPRLQGRPDPVRIGELASRLRRTGSDVRQGKVRTNSDGKYRLERLCFGDYRLSVMHDEYCDEKRVQQIVDERTITLPQITLQRGCAVEGVVTLDGVPTAGARVCVCANLDILPENAVLPDALNTFTDANGRYSFARRVPPGFWQIQAAAAEPPGKESNPFAVLIQLKESQRALQLQVGAGKNVNLALTTPDLPSR